MFYDRALLVELVGGEGVDSSDVGGEIFLFGLPFSLLVGSSKT